MELNRSNYFSEQANKEYMSCSQFKLFHQCSERALAEISGNYERRSSTALLVGSYVDAYFEGTVEEFKEKHPEILKRDGSLKAEYIKADEIINRIKKDKLFMLLMSGEKQVIMTGKISGVDTKIKIDSLLTKRHIEKIVKENPQYENIFPKDTGMIVDLKIMKDFEPIYMAEQGRLPWFDAWGYDLQGAIYREIVRQNTGEIMPFVLAAATKEPVTDLDIVEIHPEMLDTSFEMVEEEIQEYDAIKKGVIPASRCEKCDYCKETKTLGGFSSSDDFYDI